MGFTVEKLPDEPVVICTLLPPFDPIQDLPSFFAQIAQTIEGLEEPIYRILDLCAVQLSFSDITLALAEETRSALPGTLADPRIRSVVVVAPGTMQEFGAMSTQQLQYGERSSHIVTELDVALAYARAQLTT